MKLRHLRIFVLVVIATALSGQVSAQSDQGLESRVFGQGQPAKVDELPPGQLKRKIKELPVHAQGRAMKWLQDFSFPEADVEMLSVDAEGGIYYVEAKLGYEAASAGDSAPEAAPQSTLDDVFLLHSKPGASNTVYVDFNGHVFTNTAWGSGTYSAKAYSTDSDFNNFSNSERIKMVDIWHRIAEDMASFDIDVTTEQPSSFDRYTGRILITSNTQTTGADMPHPDAGGVAYVNVFGASNYHTYYSPALVYFDNLGGGFEHYVAEASSHEFGHNLGLSHDGTSTVGYYTGHGSGVVSWAPIMGVGYYENVTQWSKGEYADANQQQDDLAIIDGKLGYDSDDHGDTIAAASALEVNNGSVVSSNPELDPHNVLSENKGIIGDSSDVDVFSFIAGAGQVSLTVTPAWDAFTRTDLRGANLDVLAELRDAGNGLIASADPINETNATVTANVSAGAYYLLVTGVGNTAVPYSEYGSQGMYFINGSVPVGTADTTAPTPDPMQFSSAPAANGEDSISMTAALATDSISAVQYEFRCTAGGPQGCVANSGWQSSRSFTATGLAAGTQYTYRVAARDQSGNETAPSSPASATTDEPPPPPPYVDVNSSSDTPVSGSVSGTHSATHNDGGSTQSITERESGGKPKNRHTYLEHRWNFNIGTGATVTAFANAWRSGSNSSESFDIDYSVNGSAYSFLMNISSTSSGNVQSAVIPAAPSGSIVLRVKDTHQQSGSRTKSTFNVDHLYIQVGNPPTEPPDGPPTGMNATMVSASAINLAWVDGSSNESGFTLQRSLDGSNNWVEIANLGAGMESHGDIGLDATTQYFYRVRAWNDYGVTAWATANATTDAPPPPPPVPQAPSNLVASAASTSQINLSWNHSGDNEDGFRVERSATGLAGSWSELANKGVNASSHQDSGLSSNSTYFYRVIAYNSSGEAISNTDSATTDEEPALSLSASGFKTKGKHHISLQWTGSTNVDIYRDGSEIATVSSGSSYTDATGRKGGRTYQHYVCMAGTSTCSNTVTTVF